MRRTHVFLLVQADKSWSPPQLGERVASVHVVGVRVGTRGVIIALHPSTGCVEVIWDEAVVRLLQIQFAAMAAMLRAVML